MNMAQKVQPSKLRTKWLYVTFKDCKCTYFNQDIMFIRAFDKPIDKIKSNNYSTKTFNSIKKLKIKYFVFFNKMPFKCIMPDWMYDNELVFTCLLAPYLI